MKKLFTVLLSLALLFSCLCLGTYAVEEAPAPEKAPEEAPAAALPAPEAPVIPPAVPAPEPQKTHIVEAATAFLQNYTNNSFLYESNDPYAYSTYDPDRGSDLKKPIPAETFPFLTRTRSYLKDAVLEDHISYIAQKAWFFKSVRQYQELERENFQVSYIIHQVNISGPYAQVHLTECKSFHYAHLDPDTDTFYDDEFEIFLVYVKGAWRVFDMYSEDGFDSTTRNTDFDAQKRFETFCKNHTAPLE